MKQNIENKYTQVRKGGKSADSENVPIEMSLSLNIFPTRVTREIIYNFKNEQGRETFKKLTSEANQFTHIFECMQSLQNKCEEWQKTVETCCKQ